MGTNIYARKIPTQQELQSISQIVLEGNLFAAKQQLNQYAQIHIGKRSAGWKFLFNHNNWKYYGSIQELKDWTKTAQLETEYGQSLTWEEFWEDVEIRQQSQKSHSINDPHWYIIEEDYEFSKSTDFC